MPKPSTAFLVCIGLANLALLVGHQVECKGWRLAPIRGMSRLQQAVEQSGAVTIDIPKLREAMPSVVESARGKPPTDHDIYNSLQGAVADMYRPAIAGASGRYFRTVLANAVAALLAAMIFSNLSPKPTRWRYLILSLGLINLLALPALILPGLPKYWEILPATELQKFLNQLESSAAFQVDSPKLLSALAPVAESRVSLEHTTSLPSVFTALIRFIYQPSIIEPTISMLVCIGANGVAFLLCFFVARATHRHADAPSGYSASAPSAAQR